MLVAFWSNLHAQSGVSTNMLLISLTFAIKEKLKVMACSSQDGDLSLERSLLYDLDNFIGDKLMNYGFEPMMRYAKNGLLNKDNFSDFALPLINGLNYDLFIGSKISKQGQMERETYENSLLEILEMSKLKYDLTFVDVSSGNAKALSNSIMDISDLIVVNTNQNETAIKCLKQSSILERYKDKIIYLLGRYEDGVCFNKKNIMRRYELKPMITVPYTAQLIDVINRGETAEFIGRAYSDKNYAKKDLFRELEKSANTIKDFLKGKRHDNVF